MVSYKEGPHAASFILSEANGQRSRDNVEVPTGQKFPPGTVLSAGVPAMAGASLAIAIYGVDTTAADAEPVKVACIVRDAEVNRHCIAWEEGSDDAAIDAACVELAKQMIIVRGAPLPSPVDALAADAEGLRVQRPGDAPLKSP